MSASPPYIAASKRCRARGPARPPRTNAAFTRTELAALLAVLAFVVGVTLPALANARPRAQRLTCLSNLREVGQGFAAWSAEFGNRLPIQVPYTEGGARNQFSGLQNTAWFQFAIISNHVRSPRIFACPSDPAKREATGFDSTALSGFVHPVNRDNALSYFISHPLFEDRTDILAGDRHITNSFITGCAYWNPSRALDRINGPTPLWSDALHPAAGNIVLSDGRVDQVSSAGLRRQLLQGNSDNSGQFHFLAP